MSLISGIGSSMVWPGNLNNMTANFIARQDTNNDKSLSFDELGKSEDIFASIDKNNDSQVDSMELDLFNSLARINHETTNLINTLDTDDNGMLSFEELGEPEDVFANIDKNDDGQINRLELNHSNSSAQVNGATTNLINTLDTDGNGVLSFDELGKSEDFFASIDNNDDVLGKSEDVSASSDDVFASIDKNGDGQVDRMELNRYHFISLFGSESKEEKETVDLTV